MKIEHFIVRIIGGGCGKGLSYYYFSKKEASNMSRKLKALFGAGRVVIECVEFEG
jgi:hypothetical protein